MQIIKPDANIADQIKIYYLGLTPWLPSRCRWKPLYYCTKAVDLSAFVTMPSFIAAQYPRHSKAAAKYLPNFPR